MQGLRGLLSRGRVFIAYLTVGDPLVDDVVVEALVNSGVDVFELGLPTGSPKYDGPAIRASYRRALDNMVTVDKAISLVRDFPVDYKIIFTYFDLALGFNIEDFMNSASNARVKSVLFPDLLIDYLEDLNTYTRLCERYGLEPVFFITSCFPHRLVSNISRLNPAFIYLGLMASTGVLLPITVSRTIKIMKGLVGNVPLIVGFALSQPQQVSDCINAGADGVVVGSAILELIGRLHHEEKSSKLRDYVSSLVGRVRNG